MTDIVELTVRKWRQSQLIWGQSDCMLSIADYLVSCGYDDYGTPFRGTYNDEDGARRMIADAGGELEIMRRPGLITTLKPQRGDIMLIELSLAKVAALCTGNAVAMRLNRGVCECDIRFIKFIEAWKVNQCHPSAH